MGRGESCLEVACHLLAHADKLAENPGYVVRLLHDCPDLARETAPSNSETPEIASLDLVQDTR